MQKEARQNELRSVNGGLWNPKNFEEFSKRWIETARDESE